MNSDFFQSIQPLWEQFPSIGESGARQVSSNDGQNVFTEIFQSAIDNVKATDAEKNQAQYLLATGQLDNPADLTMAITKAELSSDLLIQLRNRALDAYSEISRISL